MLNCIKTLKKYCKATLKVFFNKKIVMMTTIFSCMIDLLCQIKVLLLNM